MYSTDGRACKVISTIISNDLPINVRFEKQNVTGELVVLYNAKSTLVAQQHLCGIQNEKKIKCINGNSRGVQY